MRSCMRSTFILLDIFYGQKWSYQWTVTSTRHCTSNLFTTGGQARTKSSSKAWHFNCLFNGLSRIITRIRSFNLDLACKTRDVLSISRPGCIVTESTQSRFYEATSKLSWRMSHYRSHTCAFWITTWQAPVNYLPNCLIFRILTFQWSCVCLHNANLSRVNYLQ